MEAARKDAVAGKIALDPHRPGYHFLPPKNWMNDPNGLIHFKGEYHLFYQHNPFDAAWGNMTWGHAVSKDLVRWKHLPHALHPDRPYDKGGVFSGCMVDNGGVPTAVYTGVSPEVQCIATSQDMIVWEKHPANPVIPGPPPGLEVTGFRDPCVWKEGGTWYMAVGSGIKDVGGAILLYRSKDLVGWDYLHPAATGDEKTGTMWECPNFFPLDNKWVLIVSPIPFGRAIYFIGDYKDHLLTPQFQGEMDQGGCFYAPQTFRDAGGRRIVFGWLWEGRSADAQKEAGWAGIMSLPRILKLRSDGRLGFEPAGEMQTLRESHSRLTDIEVNPGVSGFLKEVNGDCLEIIAEIAPGGAAEFGLKVRLSPGGEEETRILCNRKDNTLSIDLDRASTDPSTHKGIRSTTFSLAPDEILKLHIFLDRSVVEVYANGHTCLTSRIYPARSDSLGVDLFSQGGSAKVKSFDVWYMNPIWQHQR